MKNEYLILAAIAAFLYFRNRNKNTTATENPLGDSPADGGGGVVIGGGPVEDRLDDKDKISRESFATSNNRTRNITGAKKRAGVKPPQHSIEGNLRSTPKLPKTIRIEKSGSRNILNPA
jgi:hypothetical protein